MVHPSRACALAALLLVLPLAMAQPLLEISKAVSGSSSPIESVVGAGIPFTYTITLTNTGGVDATEVVLTDALPAGVNATEVTGDGCVLNSTSLVTCTWATLSFDPTDEANKKVVAITAVAPEVTTGEPLVNNASVVSAEIVDPVLSNDVSVFVEPTRLVVTKTASPNPAIPGENVTFTGDANATEVALTDILPAGLVPTTVSPADNCNITDDGAEPPIYTITCSLGDLNVGGRRPRGDGPVDEAFFGGDGQNGGNGPEFPPRPPVIPSITVTYTASAADVGTYTNQASVSAFELTPVVAAVNLYVEPTRLAVTKTVDPDAVTPNVPVTYTVTITNTGDADAAAVTLRDELPTGLTPTDVSAEIADVCQILPDTPVEGIFTIFCEDLGLLAVNASLTVNYTASAAEVGVYTNEAEVRALDVGVVEPYTATAELTVAPPTLYLTKRVSNTPVKPHSIITFTLEVSGNQDFSGVELVDYVPSAVTVLNTTGPCLFDFPLWALKCTWPELLLGETQEVEIVATSAWEGEYVNEAVLSAQGADDATANATVVFTNGDHPEPPHPPGPGPHPHPDHDKKCTRFNPRLFERRIKSNTKKHRVVVQKLASTKRWNRHSLKEVERSLKAFILKSTPALRRARFSVKVAATRKPRDATVTVDFPAGGAGTSGSLHLVKAAASCNRALLRAYRGAALKDTEVAIKRH